MPNGQSQKDVLIRIVTQAVRTGLQEAAEDLRKVAQEQREAAQASREVRTSAQLAQAALNALRDAARNLTVALTSVVRQGLGGLARGLASILNPVRYVKAAVSSLWDVLKMAFGYALGRMIVRFIQDPIGALQELERSIFGLTSTLSILQMQLEVMLPAAFGTAGDAMSYLWDMILRTSAGIEELTGGMKVLTAFGIDYRQWLELLTDVSAGTGRSVESLAYAIGLVSQGTARGIYYLRLAGVNVRELGVQTNKLGRITGSTTDALMKLFVGLEKQYGGMSARVGKSFRIVLQNLGDFVSLLWTRVWDPIVGTDGVLTQALNRLYRLFVDVDRKALTPLSQNLLALASVVGERLANAFKRLEGFVSETARGMQVDLYDLAQWGTNLMATMADGILTGIDQYLIPAIVAVTEVIAAFLAPGSPPQRGLLRYIAQWGSLLFEEFLRGFGKADFGVLDEATGILRRVLRGMVAAGDIAEKAVVPALLRARQDIAQLLSTFRETGVLDEAMLAQVVSHYGEWGDEVEQLIRLHVQLTAEQQKLQELERRREEVQDQIRETVLRMRREGYTEEAIQAWREWFAKTKLGAIDEQIDAQRDVISELEDQYSWQRELIDAQMEQLGLIEEQISLLERLERAVRKATRAARKLAEGLIVGPPPELPIDVPSLMADLDELKKKWRGILDDLLKPFEALEKHWARLGDFLRGFLGYAEQATGELGGALSIPTAGAESSEEYMMGARFRSALADIAFNILPAIKGAIDSITTAVSLAYAEWKKIADLFEPVEGPLGWLPSLFKTLGGEQLVQAITFALSVESEEGAKTYIDMIAAALTLAGLAAGGLKGALITLGIIFVLKKIEVDENVIEDFNKSVMDAIGKAIREHAPKIVYPLPVPDLTALDRIDLSPITDQISRVVLAALGAFTNLKDDLIGDQGTITILILRAVGLFLDLKDKVVAAPTSILQEFNLGAKSLLRTLSVDLVGEAGIITLLRRDARSIVEELKKDLVGEEGIIPTLVSDVVGFFEKWYTKVMGDEGWLRRFVDEGVKKLGEIKTWVEETIRKLKDLINLRWLWGGGGEEGGGQFGLIVPRTGRYLLHRGEYVFNPDFPRMDIAAAIIRSLGPNLSRLVPDLSAALRALPTPMVRPQFAVASASTTHTTINNFYRGAITLKVPSQATGRSVLDELTQLQGPY